MSERRNELAFAAVGLGTLAHLLVTMGAHGKPEDELPFTVSAVVVALVTGLILAALDRAWATGKAGVETYTAHTGQQAIRIRNEADRIKPIDIVPYDSLHPSRRNDYRRNRK